MKSDFCLKCQQPGHTSDECPRKYPPAARLMVLLAGLLLTACATSNQIITEAKDCAAQGGCVVVSWRELEALAQHALEQGLQRGVQSCRRNGT